MWLVNLPPFSLWEIWPVHLNTKLQCKIINKIFLVLGLHHYQQNERLFLEPTITNRKGQSLCVECSAPQPRDPHQEPYLYHITLGGLKTNADKRHSTASVNQFSNRGKVNNRVSNMKSKKISADMYARLNDRIDNILGRRDIHSTFSRHSAPLNSPIPSYSKRSPSRSMALMDHIIWDLCSLEILVCVCKPVKVVFCQWEQAEICSLCV